MILPTYLPYFFQHVSGNTCIIFFGLRIFANGRLSQNFYFYFDNVELEVVKEIPYLGLTFSRTGSFASTKKILVTKAYHAMYDVL